MTIMGQELLASYLDDALSETESTYVEKELRESAALQQQLEHLIQQRDRGEHSVGAVWRRRRLSCPSRDQLGSYLLGVLDEDVQDYIKFHLETIGCAFCLANVSDLQAQQQEAAAHIQQRRKRYFQSSAGLLQSPPQAPE